MSQTFEIHTSIQSNNGQYMGLNNTLCKNPKFWCPIHQVYLSESDVQSKGCRSKKTFDMMSTYVCPSLTPIDEHIEKCAVTREIVQNMKLSKKNAKAQAM